MSRRGEDELRAAFAAKATEAPPADDVLRAVRREVYTAPRRPRWLVPAVAAAAAVAVGVPLGLGLSGSDSGSTKGAGDHAERAPGQSGTFGERSGTSAGPGAAKVPSAPAAAGADAASAVCRPSDVTVTVRRDTAGATLTVTSRGAACRLDRVPQVQWADDGAYRSTPESDSGGKPRSADQLGVLPGGATATATVRSTGPCGEPAGDLVRVDWGSGPVEAHAGAGAQRSCAQPSTQVLRVSAFAGLS
jgi:hypothetical protein